MRCKNCDYGLWGLKARTCPECGRPFAPGEFEFVPGSVRFACPHCEQSYYGTSAGGHLVPVEFDCVGCGRHVSMDEMVLFPAEGLQEQQTDPERQPWLERAERGRVRSWFRTVGMAMVAPQRLMRLTPAESSVGAAWWFAVVCQSLYGATAFLPFLVFILIAISSTRAATPGVFGFGGGFSAVLLVAWVGLLFVIALWGLVVHAILLITGGTAHTIGRTYQALCYGSGANALMAIPCLGVYLFGLASIWWMISSILMLKEGQRVHGARAALAVLIFPVAVFVGIILLIVLARSFRPPATMAGAGPPSAVSQSVNAQRVLDALLDYSSQHNGSWPAHSVELLRGNYLRDPGILLLTDTEGRKTRILLAGTALADFQDLALEEKNEVVRKMVAGLPSKPVAHRLGDFVFTYHGIAPASADRDLWLFIVWPDKTTGGGLPGDMVTVGRAGGVWQFPASSMRESLAEQNQLRARYGSLPLPYPWRVAGE